MLATRHILASCSKDITLVDCHLCLNWVEGLGVLRASAAQFQPLHSSFLPVVPGDQSAVRVCMDPVCKRCDCLISIGAASFNGESCSRGQRSQFRGHTPAHYYTGYTTHLSSWLESHHHQSKCTHPRLSEGYITRTDGIWRRYLTDRPPDIARGTDRHTHTYRFLVTDRDRADVSASPGSFQLP